MSQRFPTSHPEHPTKLQLGLPIHCWTKSRLQNKHLVDRGMFQPSGIIFYLGCLWEEHPNLNLQQIVKFLLWQAIIHVLCYVFKNIKTVNCYSSGIKDLTFRILWLTFVLNKIKNSNGLNTFGPWIGNNEDNFCLNIFAFVSNTMWCHLGVSVI